MIKFQILILLVSSLLLTECKTLVRYINPTKLMQGYQGAIVKRAAFTAKAKTWQLNLDSLTKELSALPPSATQARKAKEQQYLQYREALQQQAAAEQQKLDKEVLDEVNAYIKQYGKEKGYDFILGATDNGNIVYAAEGTDVTEEVLKGLNEQYAKQHPATP
ncbi:OmpH family outer membrane protein [Hymenobacter sp. DG01]|uniref:OmpH family outer membrane protein n=1 Tax=Hymenobacter sp. DG01 TaxID=2584940 RepID=UPI00111E6FF6|nr:OmpH family outer membrane protein [Hymenobacter sp. DG01]